MPDGVIRRGADIHDIIVHRKQMGNIEIDARAYVDQFRQELHETGKSIKTSRLKSGRIISVTNTAISGGGWTAIHEDITERVGDEEALFNQAAELARINLRFDAADRKSVV